VKDITRVKFPLPPQIKNSAQRKCLENSACEVVNLMLPDLEKYKD
jgi:hypothetical protein